MITRAIVVEGYLDVIKARLPYWMTAFQRPKRSAKFGKTKRGKGWSNGSTGSTESVEGSALVDASSGELI